MAGLDSRGKPMASRTPARARGRVGRLPTNCPSSQPGKSATRVATGVKIITHTVPLAAAGTKVMTKGGGQPVLVVPSSAAPPPAAAAAAAAAVRPAVAVRTGSGGRVVTVSGGVGRQLVRHSLHGYALPRAVHVGRSPSGGSPTNRAPASVIVLQKSAAGRPPTVVRPPRARSDSGAAAVFVSAPQTASPAARLPAPSPAPTPAAAPAPLSAAAAPAATPVSAQDQQQVNSSSVLSDILHATGIINPKAAPDGVSASPPPSGGIQKAPPPPAPAPVPAADSGRPPPSSPGPGRPPPPPPEPPAAVAAAPPPLADTDSSNDTGESITLEQAVQLMNHQTSNPGQSRQILRRAGIRLGEAPDGVTGAVLQASGGDRLPSDPSMELVGELDPQTGIFYPVTQNSAGGAVLEGSDLVQDSTGETLEDISAFLQQRHDPVPSAAPEVSK
ncbi:transcription initiation factor TFIID subunit 4-like [Amphibalanus amphitrite]|uniref:transcription initiation factor TFIID subunit 4-like n=1 Tax=Amphibalanus amphitrite TaxID=1232801 RepID=UPI001C922698|nr:transcription initiation factor TFIID subunit 4-like [Amphibalanus amphitrite]